MYLRFIAMGLTELQCLAPFAWTWLVVVTSCLLDKCLQMTRIVLPGMKERKKGAVVNIGSAAATVAPSGPLYAVYAGTKVMQHIRSC